MIGDCHLSGNNGQTPFVLTGTAILSDGRTQESVDVEFEPAHGRCTVTPPSENGSACALYFYFHGDKRVHLLDVYVRPNGKGAGFRAEELGPFMIAGSVHGQADHDSNIASSPLAQVLGLSPVTSPLSRLKLLPEYSRTDFEISDLGGKEDSECLYRCLPPRAFDVDVVVSGVKVRIHTFKVGSSLAEYVRCEIASTLTDDRLETIRVALSLFFRRRAFRQVARSAEKVHVDLSAPGQVLSYGLLVRNPKNFQDAIQRLIDTASAHNWYLLVEAFSNPGALEVRMLNAMVHLEVVTGQNEISSQTLAERFGVGRGNAELIKEFRNRLIHDGRGMKHAMQKARVNLAQKPGGEASTKVLNQAFQTESPHGHFYCALMDLFSLHLADESGIPWDWVEQKTALSFLE